LNVLVHGIAMTSPDLGEEMDRMPREALLELQERAIRELFSGPVSPFYERKWGGTPGVASHEDLAEVPLTDRGELVSAQEEEVPWGGLLTLEPTQCSLFGFSNAIAAGMPGHRSLRIAATADDMRSGVERASRAFSMGGASQGEGAAIVGEVARSVLHHQFLGGLAGIGATPFQTGRGLTLRHVRHTLPAMAPTQIVTHPTYAIHIAGLLEDEGTRLPVERLFLWGEMGPSVPTVRATIEEAWHHAEVRDVYAVEELGVLAAECEAGNGLHCFEDRFVYEIIDPSTGDALGPGERGELVVTTIGAGAMPLVRYRTGDLVITDDGRCACGRTHQRLHVLGRVVEGPSGEPMTIELAKVENLLGRLRSLWGLYRIVIEEDAAYLEVPMASLDEDMQAVAINTTLLAARSTGIELRPVKELPSFHHRAWRVVRSDEGAWWEALAEEQGRLEL
jgi:phenylacetate-CoA ligase